MNVWKINIQFRVEHEKINITYLSKYICSVKFLKQKNRDRDVEWRILHYKFRSRSFVSENLSGTTQDKMTVITVHAYFKSWNDAQFICEDQGGTLYKADSAEKKLVLTKIQSKT